MILITGAGGMLGTYIAKQFPDKKVMKLGLRPESDFVVDLTKETPDLNTLFQKVPSQFQSEDHSENEFTVIHTAGTEDDEKAMELNLEGTKRLLMALEINPPDNFVYVSSYKVYSRDAGENITEEENTWATDIAGKSKALTEEILREWCLQREITLTIIRPARMFGTGVKGETLRLFNDALAGKYIHVRGNDAKISIVCALDVARMIEKVYHRGGIYNAADNNPVKYIDMVEAMTANAGAKKRMTHLPAAWAEWIWRLGRLIPSIDRNLHPSVVEARMKTLTLDGSRLSEKSGLPYHSTLSVIERTDSTYPYDT